MAKKKKKSDEFRDSYIQYVMIEHPQGSALSRRRNDGVLFTKWAGIVGDGGSFFPGECKYYQ